MNYNQNAEGMDKMTFGQIRKGPVSSDPKYEKAHIDRQLTEAR